MGIMIIYTSRGCYVKSYKQTHVKHFYLKQRLSHNKSSVKVRYNCNFVSICLLMNDKDHRISELIGCLHRFYLSAPKFKCTSCIIVTCLPCPPPAPFASSHSGNSCSWWFVSSTSQWMPLSLVAGQAGRDV